MKTDPIRYSTQQHLARKPVKGNIAGKETIISDKFQSSKADSSLNLIPGRQMFKSAETGKSAEIAGEFKAGFVTDFVDAQQVDNKLMEMAKKFPDLVDVTTRPYRTSGYDGKRLDLRGSAPLRYVRIGKKSPDKDKKVGVLLMAAPHAREVMQPMIMLETLQQLLENYNPDSKDPQVKELTDLMDSVDIYIVPVSNPDGLNFALYDDPMWRKTRSHIPGSLERGVDCNRNYDFGWLPMDPETNRYSGTHPFSEPETRNMATIIDKHPNIKFVADFHSRGEEIRRPKGVKDPDDLKNYKKFQSRMQKAIGSIRGKKYDLIESNVVNGSSDDYFYFKKGAYSFVVEDGTEYKPPLGEALNVVKENTEGAKELLRIARDFAASREFSG